MRFTHFFCLFVWFASVHRFSVTVDDCPGGIADLCRILADVGVSIKDIMHERAWLRDIYKVVAS